MSKKVEIMCIGAQKAGTTSLHHLLKQHPQLELPYIKELYYFSDDKQYQSLDNFHRHYSFNDDKIAVNVTPAYMCNKKAIQRIYDYNPNMKLILILRQPTQRCISQYLMRHRNLMEHRSFKEVMHEELSLKFFEDRECKSILYRSLYDVQIENILSIFPRDQVYFIKFEEFSSNQSQVMKDLISWCELPPFEFQFIHTNEKFKGSNSMLWRIVMRIPHAWILRFQEIFKVNLRGLVKRIVKNDRQDPIIDAETIETLNEFFKESIVNTARLSGLNCDDWFRINDKK
jgi:hypothetical protein